MTSTILHLATTLRSEHDIFYARRYHPVVTTAQLLEISVEV